MKKIILSHSGKQHAYHVAKALYRLGILKKIYTSGYIKSTSLQLLSKIVFPYLRKRFIDGLPGELIHSNWKYEIKEQLDKYLKKVFLDIQNLVFQRDIEFNQSISQKLKQDGSTLFWGFQGSCYETLKTLETNNILEWSTGHTSSAISILHKESSKHPEWSDSRTNFYFPKEYEKISLLSRRTATTYSWLAYEQRLQEVVEKL